MTTTTDPPIAPVIPIGSARKRVEAQREAELERRVAERWTGPVSDEDPKPKPA